MTKAERLLQLIEAKQFVALKSHEIEGLFGAMDGKKWKVTRITPTQAAYIVMFGRNENNYWFVAVYDKKRDELYSLDVNDSSVARKIANKIWTGIDMGDVGSKVIAKYKLKKED